MGLRQIRRRHPSAGVSLFGGSRRYPTWFGVLVLRRERLSIPEQGPHDPLPPIEYEVLAEGEGTWRSVPVTEGDLAWRCPKCGLVVDGLTTARQVASAAETHEEFVHRLGLFIEAPVEPDTD